MRKTNLQEWQLKDSNQIFRNDSLFAFIISSKISTQIIEPKIFAPYELFITTFFSMLIPLVRGNGGWFVIFQIFNFILFFVDWIS